MTITTYEEKEISEHIPKQNKLTFSMPSSGEMAHLIDFCKMMSTAPFYQRLGPGGIMGIYLTAKEYDLPFMGCLNGGLHVVDGKVTFSAVMIDALILKAGHKTEVLKLDDKSCKIRFIRGDRSHDKNYKPFEYEYTVEKAQKAGYLSKNNWKTSLDDMLYCRCMTGGGRKHIPEVFVGVLLAGELTNTNADEDIQPETPYHDPKELQERKMRMDQESKEALDKFKLKHELFDSDEESEKRTFLIESTKTGKSIDQTIQSAFNNEKGFIEAFEKWKEKQNIAEQSQ